MAKTITDPRKSKMHKRVMELLRKLYPSFRIEEETPVECGRQRTLPVDIVVRDLKCCIECHGIQHFEFNTLFHQSKEDLTAQQTRDQQKRDAIINAGFAYLVVRYDEYEKLTPTKLAKRITKALKEKH